MASTQIIGIETPGLPFSGDVADPDLALRNAMVVEHLSDVRSVALGIYRRLPKSVQLDDLVQAGTLGLIEAATRMDKERPLGFRQYARIRITGAILDSLREQDWASRYMRTRQQKLEVATRELETRLGRQAESQEVAEVMGMDLQSFFEYAAAVEDLHQVEDCTEEEDGGPAPIERIADDERNNPDEQCARTEIRETITDAMGYLKAEHRRVLRMYYFEERTMAEIASAMHLTESRISQIHSAALREMFVRLRAKNARAFKANLIQ